MATRQTDADPLAAPAPGEPDGGVRAFWTNAAIGFFRCSPEWRPLLVNPALARLHGYDTGEEMLADLTDGAAEAGRYVDPGRRREFRRILEARGMVTGFRSEIRRHRTHERIWVSENAWAVPDALGRILYYEGTVTDVTTEVHAEVHATAALAESEKRLAGFARTASDWFWETGPDHRFSPLAGRGGRADWSPRDLAADLDDRHLPELLATLDRCLPFRDIVLRVRFTDGTTHHVAVSGQPVFAADGAFLGHRGSARDVSGRIDAERRHREAWRQADETSRAKSEFLATMSHELREPLNAIIGFADVMREGTLPVELCAEYAGHIHDSGTHLLDLINDVLDMSKIIAGKMRLHLEPVRPEEALSRAAAMVALRAEQGGIRLEISPDPDLPSLRADGLRLGQILLNLVSNAVKFTPSGGRITLRCRRDGGGHLLFEVADTGEGMTQEEIELAQQPFAQVHRDGGARPMAEGSGLGLSITRNLVELHDGTFRIESVRGSGTTVRVLLPIEGPRR
ncbi:MAG TPA: PAS domain-containing sensor histidine kinase [Arenibaculum sp.]|nr:PAS domain-containing sensor histidine kinase [Arenibaculum sp.]